MASRIWDRLSTFGKSRIILQGRFMPNGTGAVSNISAAGIASIARTAVGTFVITLQDKYPGLIYADATLLQTTPTNVSGKAGWYTAGAAGVRSTFTCYAWDGTAGAAVDVASSPATMMTFQLGLSNSTITLGG